MQQFCCSGVTGMIAARSGGLEAEALAMGEQMALAARRCKLR
jgi:hypothetical protein